MAAKTKGTSNVPALESVKEYWELFAEATIPPEAGRPQRDAMYQAFLGGVFTVLEVEKIGRKDVFAEWRLEVQRELQKIGTKSGE